MSSEPQRAPRVPRWLIYVMVGLAAGLMSGLFGVGGGIIIVPVLVLSFTAQGDRKSVV